MKMKHTRIHKCKEKRKIIQRRKVKLLPSDPIDRGKTDVKISRDCKLGQEKAMQANIVAST